MPNYYESDIKTGDSNSNAVVCAGGESRRPDEEPVKDSDAQNSHEHQRELLAVDNLPWAHPKRIFAAIKLILLYGMKKDVIAHQSKGLDHVHQHAVVFDNRVEHLWTTAQVCSAMVSFSFPQF